MNRSHPKALVKMSESCIELETWHKLTWLCLRWSQMKRVNFNVLSSLMKNGIPSNVHGSLIIISDLYWGLMRYTKGTKQALKPNQFSCGGCYKAIFSLGRQLANCGMLLCLPRDRATIEGDKISRNGPPSHRATYPTSITELLKSLGMWSRQENTLTGTLLDITKDP